MSIERYEIVQVMKFSVLIELNVMYVTTLYFFKIIFIIM
jgi:hypothetical protein